MGDERDQEAEKCIAVAKRALSDGDLQKSIKFLKKSLNFRHSTIAENLLKKVEDELESSTTPHRKPSPSPSPSPPPYDSSSSSTSNGPAKRAAAASHQSSSSTSSSSTNNDAPKRDYTPEQQQAARKINKTTDYYQILSIERTVDEAGIKAAYRKMALKFHPDKNHAPEAEEAFKKVSEAYTCLSDANEREYYNQNGSRGNAQRARNAAYASAAGGYRDQPMTPEELFNMFFEAQGVRRQQHFHRQRQHQNDGEGQQQQQQRGGLANLAHFLPLILLFLFSFMSGPSTDSSVFSLDKTDVFSIRRTSPQQTPYYVNPSFARNYARDYRALAQVEAQADQLYFKKLGDECRAETKAQKQAVGEAKRSKSQQAEMLQKAHSMPLPACARLAELGRG